MHVVLAEGKGNPLLTKAAGNLEIDVGMDVQNPVHIPQDTADLEFEGIERELPQQDIRRGPAQHQRMRAGNLQKNALDLARV